MAPFCTAAKNHLFFLLFYPVVFCAQSPKYVAEATFQQNTGQQDTGMDMRKIVQQYFFSPAENKGTSLLQSRELIKKTVADLGLQMHVKTLGRLSSSLCNVGKQMKIFLGGALKDPDPFLFKDVYFTSEKARHFYLKVLQEDTFLFLDEKKEVMGMGKVGQPCSFSALAFTLVHLPKELKRDHYYAVSVTPWQAEVEWFHKALDIRGSKSIVHFSCSL